MKERQADDIFHEGARAQRNVRGRSVFEHFLVGEGVHKRVAIVAEKMSTSSPVMKAIQMTCTRVNPAGILAMA